MSTANGPVVFPISGTGVTAGTLVFSPTTASFGIIPVGASSKPLTITATNNTSSPVSYLSSTNTAALKLFNIKTGNCKVLTGQGMLAPGASCSFTATFSPSTIGPVNASVTLSTGQGPVLFSFSGTAVAAVPVANAGGPYQGLAGQAISFSGSRSTAPVGQALTYAWNFGDGGSGAGVSPTHAYSLAGGYTVALTVTDTAGTSATATSAVSVTATSTTQTITFTNPGGHAAGTPLTLVASASSGLPVTFTSATPAVCTVSGTSATLLATGTCTIDANQAGNATYAAAPQVAQSFAVTSESQTITFTNPGGHAAGSPLTLIASASSGLLVTFTSATPAVCTVSGTSATLLSVGTCTIDANQAGNATYAAAPQVAQSFAVTSESQTITFTNPGGHAAGTPLTLVASASSGLPVTFTSATPAVCTVSGTSATLLSVGTCTIEANQAGNATYAAAPQVAQSFAVTSESQTITFTNPGGHAAGTPLTLVASASSGLPVTFTSATPAVCTVSGTSATLLSVGTCTIEANQAGNATYAAAPQVAQSFAVTSESQTITFTNPGGHAAGTPLTLVASASSGLPVTFTSATPAVCTVSGTSATLLSTGTCTIDANQAGNATYAAAPQVAQSFAVTSESQTITFTNPGGHAAGTPLTLVASASSGLPVTFTSATPAVCTVSGTSATLLSVGTCTIDANQAGNATYAAAPQVVQSFAVTSESQTITFTNPGGHAAGSPLTLIASASSGLPVTFTSATPAVCTVTGTSATLLATGTCTIDANQAGNATYAAAPQVAQSFAVTSESQTITFSNPGGHAAGTPLTLVASASSGLPVTFTSATPAVCTVSGTSATLLATGTCTIDANQAGNATYAAAPQVAQSFAVSASAAPATLSSTSLSFAAQLVGTTGAASIVTLTNAQLSATLHLSGASITGTNSGDFSFVIPNSCADISPGGNCQILVYFSPLISGTRTAQLNLFDDVSNSPQTVSLTGPGNAPLSVLPGSITTFTAPVGSASTGQTITLTNNNTTAQVTINSFQLSGDFKLVTTSCGTPSATPNLPPYVLPKGASCTVAIQFVPTVGGTRTGQLQVNDSDLTSPQVVSLSGTGTSPLTVVSSPSVQPPALIFPAQPAGTRSGPKTITLTNNEVQSETFSLNLAGDYVLAGNNCPSGHIGSQSSCIVAIEFAPGTTVANGPDNGSVTISDSAPGGVPLVVSLAGSVGIPQPAVAEVSPGFGDAGNTSLSVVVTGNGYTHFNASSVISFADTDDGTVPSDITVTVPNPSATTANQIAATLNIGANTAANPVTYGARNITVTTTLAGGGTETAFLDSGFTIYDPNDVHTITVVNPSSGAQGQTLDVGLTATGTNFIQGTTIVNFGTGITVNSLSISSPTTAVANITISNTTSVGNRTIVMATGGEYASASPTAFQVTANNATLVRVSESSTANVPVVEPQSFGGPVYLTATGTHFLQDATQVSIGGGVLVGDVTVTSPTTATAQVALSSAVPGTYSVTVSTGGEIATLSGSFTVTGSTPALLSVTPSTGTQGQTGLTLVIQGNNFTNFSKAGGNTLTLNMTGLIAVTKLVVNNPHQVTATIAISQTAPAGTIAATLVSDDGGTTINYPFSFTISPSSASIVSVSPNNVPQGGQVTLTLVGQNTIWSLTSNPVTSAAFYPEPVVTPTVDELNVTDMTDATLNITVPTGTPVGDYPFYLATGGQVVSSSIHVYANTPSMTMSPANGLVPSSGVNSFGVSFSGQFTNWNLGCAPTTTTIPVISGAGVTLTNFCVTSAYSATATLSIAAGAATNQNSPLNALCGSARVVTLTTGAQAVNSCFNVTTTPVEIISVNPSQAPQGITENVEILGLNTHFAGSTNPPAGMGCLNSATPTTVLFGPEIGVNWVCVKSPTDLVSNITTSFTFNSASTNTTPGYQTIYVNTGNESVTGAEQVLGSFSVQAPASPILLSVVPSSAPQGSTEDITITGSMTHWIQGETEAILGAGVTVANLAITSPTTATATISVSPTAPVGGNSVTMITGTEIVGGTGFSVTPSNASIQSVGPVCNVAALTSAVAAICGGTGTGNPFVVSQLQTTTLNVVGVGTHWLQGDTSFSFGGGIFIDALKISSPTTATVQITVLSSAPVGFATLTADTDGESVSLQQAIDIEEGFPTLLAISPASGSQGATITDFQILGRFTHFCDNVTTACAPGYSPTQVTFSGSPGITASKISAIDNDTLTATINIDPTAYVDLGACYTCYPCAHVVTVTTTSNEQVSTAPILDNFCVTQGPAQINSVSLPAIPAGNSGTITIVGSSTHFKQGVTTVSFGDSNLSVPNGDVSVTDATHLTATIAASTTATPGTKTVTVATFGEVASEQFAFSVIPDQPQLTEASPYQAEQGQQLYLTPSQTGINVVLTGQYTHFSTQSTATFGPGIVVNSVTYNTSSSGTQVTANITIDPLSYAGGRTVTVTTPGVPCADQSVNITLYGCSPGQQTGTGSEIVSAGVFSIIPGPAIISNVSPNTGNEGQEVVFHITGTDTHWQQNFTQFYIAGGGTDLTVNSVIVNNPTSATVDMNISPTANPGVRSIYMSTAGEILIDSGAFVVTGGVPAVANITPGGGLTGAGPVEVTIHGIYTLWNPSTTRLQFGPGVTVSSYQVDDNFNIEAVLSISSTATLGYNVFSVVTGTQVLTGNFLVTAAPGSPGAPPPPAPFIWSESPSTAIPGQTLNVSFAGLYTHWDPNPLTGTQFSFGTGIHVNTCQVLGETSALCNITITATTAQTNLVVLTTGTETEDANFNVVIAQPVLSVVDPGSAIQGATNLTVDILGQFTAFDSTTTFSFGPNVTIIGAPTILSPTVATQTISIPQLAPTGGYPVVANTPDAPAIAQSVVGAGFSVTPSLALISAITPNVAQQGATGFAVEVTGQNTHWSGSTVFQFGSGITVTSAQVNSNTDATLTLSIPALAAEGPTYVSASTGGEVASIGNGFVVTAGTPYLLSSGPGSLPQQGAATFTILAQQTGWSAANPPVVSYGAGVNISTVNVTSPQSLTVTGSIQATTPVGYRSLTVTNGTQVLSLANVLYITSGPAVINSVSPGTGGQGVHLPAVQIVGTNTNWLQGTTTLTFPGVLVNSFTVKSPTLIAADITVSAYAPAGQVSVTATTLGEVATATNVFTVTQTQPQLLAVVPGSAPQGWTTQNVALTGDFTHFCDNVTTTCPGGYTPSVANFGAGIKVNSVTANGFGSLVANVTVAPTANLGYRNVSVATGPESVQLANAFNVFVGPAAIANLNPTNAAENSTATIAVTGSQTHFANGVTSASFGGGITVSAVTVVDPLHATVSISIPGSTPQGAYDVTLTTGGEVATILGGFTVTAGTPRVQTVSPATAHQGNASVSVALTGQFTHFVNGTSVASFGTGITVNSLVVGDATDAVANITVSPSAAVGPRNVTVTTGTEAARITGGFTVLAGVPAVASVAPSSAMAGTTGDELLIGAFTSFQQGVSTVSFGAGVTVNSVTVSSATQLTANVTIDPTVTLGARDVSVTTGAQAVALSGGFTITAGMPQVHAVSPATSPQGTANVSVAVTGLFTHFINGTSVASFGSGITVNSLVVTDGTDAVASITVSPSAAVGSRNVTVTTGPETATITGGFSVLAGTPALVSATPGMANAGATANVVVAGAFTSFQASGTSATTVSFGAGVTVNSVTVSSATQLTANITLDPNATAGPRDVTVTTGSQTVVLSGGFTVTPGTPAITVINPNIGVPNATASVTLTGQYTNWGPGTTVSFGAGISVGGAALGAAGPVASASATSLTVNLTIDPAAALGPRDVTVTTGSEVEVVPAGFTVQPTTVSPPTVASISPATYGLNVPVNGSIVAVFSQPIARATVTAANVLLYLTSNPGQGNVQVPGNVTLDASGRVLTFTPTAALAVNATYQFTMTSAVTDASGNALGYYNSYFATGFASVTKAPTVVLANPPVNSGSIGTNVPVEVQFSTQMDEATQAGLTLTAGGAAVPGSFGWTTNLTGSGFGQCNNTYYYYYYYAYYGQNPGFYATCPSLGSVLTFTPAAPLQANTTYTVAYGAPLADVAGNALTPGSFTFTTGAVADTAYNSASTDFNGATNVGTNFAPTVTFAKPINPLAVNNGTLYLYNVDSNKYLRGTVTLAPNALSATFTPAMPLLPDTYYDLHMSSGYYDADGNYSYGVDAQFTTGAGEQLQPPQVVSVFPADAATAVPLNAQIVAHFSEPLDPATTPVVTLTPAGGGAAVAGVATLLSDQVTLTFVPTESLAGGKQYTVKVSGYVDMVGNAGATFSSSFTTATSVAPLSVTTGIDASGHLITTGDTVDPHWTAINSSSPNPQPVDVVTPANAGYYSGWPANGPGSAWITVSPDAVPGPIGSTYSTIFNLSGYSLNNLCLVGTIEGDPYGTLSLNGTVITPTIYPFAYGGYNPYLLSLTLPASGLVAGTNTLSYQFEDNYSNYEGLRMQASVQTCGVSLTGLALVSSSPVNGATGVAPNASVTLTFNNPIDPATVNSTTLPVDLNGSYNNQVIAGSYAVSGSQVTFTPDSPFPVNTTLYMQACNGPSDLAGDTFSGCQNLASFTTAAAAAPGAPAVPPFKVVAFTPAMNAMNVGLRAPVVATFNRSVNPATVNPYNAPTDFALFQADGQSPICPYYMKSQDNTTLQFNCNALPASSTLTAMLNGGLQDFSGNALANFTSAFTTSQADSNAAGTLVSSVPGSGSGGVSSSVNLVLYFNLPISASSATGGLQVAVNGAPIAGSVQVLDGGYTLEFTPSTPFAAGGLVQWNTTSTFTDATYGNVFTAASGYFTIAADMSAAVPAVQVVSPALYGYYTAATNSIVDIQFNVPLDPATVNETNIYLYDTLAGSNVAGTYTQPQPNEIRIVPHANLSPNSYIYLYVTSGVKSTTGVPAVASSPYFYTGSAVDATMPTIVSAVPYNGAQNIGVNVQPGFVFSKAIDPVSVNANTLQVLNGGTALAGSYLVSSDDTGVKFVPNQPLPASATLTLKVNGVLDPVGNAVSHSTQFQTGSGPDLATPTVLQTSVPNGATVPANLSITVQFSESMDVTTFNANNFYIYSSNSYYSGPVPATLSWNADQTVAYLVPSSPLAAGDSYSLAVSGGTDLAGNAMTAYYTSFTVGFGGGTSAPTVLAFNPLAGATGVGTNTIVEAEFSAAIEPATLGAVTLSTAGTMVAITPVLGAGNTVVQLVPGVPLTANTKYTVTIAGVKDPAGNAVATATNSFTTGPTFDLSAATVVSVDPPNYATVGTNVTPRLVFSKPLNPVSVSSGNFTMRLADTGQVVPITVTLSADALEVTLAPQVALLANTLYYFNGSGLQDEDGNGVSTGNTYFYTGSGPVTSGPAVTAVSPVPNSTGIPLNAQVTVSVSAVLDPASVTQTAVRLLDSSNHPVGGTLSQPDNQTLLFVPAANLAAGSPYTVKVGGFADANGNAAKPYSSTFTTGAAAATAGLTLTSSNIASGSTNVSSTQPITLTFSQLLNPDSAGTIDLYLNGSGNYPMAGGQTVSGNTVTFTPTSPYPAGGTIYVYACGTTDVLGEVFNGGCSGSLLSFTVSSASPDTTPLKVVSQSPANGAVNVGRDHGVSVTFNKPVNPSSVNYYGNTALLYAGQALLNSGSVTLSSDNQTVTFNNGSLANGTVYTIEFPAGGVTDLSGNTLASDFISSFTTTASAVLGAGSVVGTSPGNGASGVATASLLTLYVNQPVNASTLNGNFIVTVNGQVVSGTAAAAASGYEVQFTPAGGFPAGSAVQWFFSNVQDVYGNTFSSDSGYFNLAATVDPATAQPVVVAVGTPYGSSDVPVNGQVDIEYSQPLDATTVNSTNVYFASPSVPATVTLSLPNVIRITPNAAFNPSTNYYVCANTAVTGTNGVAAQGDCYATDFYTASSSTPDTTSGTMSIGPPNGSVNIGTNAYIRLQFSKPVDRTTVNASSVKVTAGSASIPGTWSYNYGGTSGADVIGANFTPLNPLPASTTVKVAATGLLDYAGNTFTAASAKFTTAALPDYTTPTVALDFGYNTMGVGTNASFTCRYSEAIDPSSITPSGTRLYGYGTNTNIPVTYAFSPDLMSVTMTPTSALAANTQYYYDCYGAIDLTGNGQQGGQAYFTTGAGPVTTGPMLVAANPPNGYTNVPLDSSNGPWNGTSLQLQFSEPVSENSLDGITLTPNGGSPLAIGPSPQYGDTIVSVALPSVLLPDTTYTFNLSGVTDYNGNAMTPTTSSFTTGSGFDFNNPTVTAENWTSAAMPRPAPLNGATGVDDNPTLSVVFSEAMDPVLLDGNHVYLRVHNTQALVTTTFSLSADLTTAYLKPAAPLATGTIYDVVTSAPNWYATDIAGNPFYPPGVVATFTTQ